MNNQGNIADLFFAAATKHPETTAIVHKEKSISYKELAEQVSSTAAGFAKSGIQKGDRVLVFVPMSIDLYRIVLALFSMGAVAVFLDEWVSKKRMEECCRIAQCKGFIGITKARILCWFSAELRKIPVKLRLKHQEQAAHAISACNPDDTALITFTTGSTGTPKAAKRTHGFLQEQFNALKEEIDPKHGDVDMSLLPIVLLINLGAGATSVIADFKAKKPKKFRPGLITSQLKLYNVNRLTASPFFIKELSKYIAANKIQTGIKQVFTGGAPVFPSEAEIYANAFPKAEVKIVYGSTEAEPISSVSAEVLVKEKETILRKGLLVGKPYHKAEVKVIPITDTPIQVTSEAELNCCRPGATGEIIVAGPHVLTAYFNNEAALKRNKIFVNGKVFHRTGDSGYLDEQGNLFLTGRCATLFKQHNEYVCPFLYENYFSGITGVEMGTVLQINNQTTVVIELNDASKKDLVKTAIEALPLKTDTVVFLKKMPRDPRHHSKIEYGRLKQLL